MYLYITMKVLIRHNIFRVLCRDAPALSLRSTVKCQRTELLSSAVAYYRNAYQLDVISPRKISMLDKTGSCKRRRINPQALTHCCCYGNKGWIEPDIHVI